MVFTIFPQLLLLILSFFMCACGFFFFFFPFKYYTHRAIGWYTEIVCYIFAIPIFYIIDWNHRWDEVFRSSLLFQNSIKEKYNRLFPFFRYRFSMQKKTWKTKTTKKKWKRFREYKLGNFFSSIAKKKIVYQRNLMNFKSYNLKIISLKIGLLD